MAVETRIYEIGGVRTSVRVTGRGKPVLFLHGASTLEGFDFAEGLADRFQMICPSHPGMGDSGDAPHLAGASDVVIHYLNLLDAMGLEEKPHLMGFSMGGWLASELAAVAREKFDRLVLLAPAGLNDPAHPATPLSQIAPAEFPGYLAHDVAVALQYFPDGSDNAAAEAFGMARGREGETVGRICAPHGMGHPNLRRLLARITNPALVVWGEKDRILPASQAPLWVETLPDAQLITLPDTGHLIAQERPEALQTIGDFLAA
ncbi:alpha/beta fold hydrolase [Falsigemmobacter faecalis]|uniref:Alpha/beta hydrolase n=1 Tax=Falsigemmobacter faecalis TaxID=2488730 RepID=A0A3P3D6Z4_9RHOB|nr:alpha/beta hydrolase [Falsigemmobacter faecalis]RRH69336.1 alpha/beta hydrolase [Falsigemmobacter faecalis]